MISWLDQMTSPFFPHLISQAGWNDVIFLSCLVLSSFREHSLEDTGPCSWPSAHCKCVKLARLVCRLHQLTLLLAISFTWYQCRTGTGNVPKRFETETFRIAFRDFETFRRHQRCPSWHQLLRTRQHLLALLFDRQQGL